MPTPTCKTGNQIAIEFVAGRAKAIEYQLNIKAFKKRPNIKVIQTEGTYHLRTMIVCKPLSSHFNSEGIGFSASNVIILKSLLSILFNSSKMNWAKTIKRAKPLNDEALITFSINLGDSNNATCA